MVKFVDEVIEMGINEAYIESTCPKCGGVAYSEGVHNGVGYVHPPLRCYECNWIENCPQKASMDEECKKCEWFGVCVMRRGD